MTDRRSLQSFFLYAPIILALCGIFFLKSDYLLQQKEINNLHKTLAHQELVNKALIDRYNFLRYVLSESNVRISALEDQRNVEVTHHWDPIEYKPGGG